MSNSLQDKDLENVEGFENADEWGHNNWKGKRCMKLVTCHYPIFLIELTGKLVERGWYPNKSEALREALRLLLRDHGMLKEE